MVREIMFASLFCMYGCFTLSVRIEVTNEEKDWYTCRMDKGRRSLMHRNNTMLAAPLHSKVNDVILHSSTQHHS